MGIFSRHTRNGPTVTNGSRRHSRRRTMEPYSMATRPSFGQWLKVTWLDIVTMVIMGVLGLGVSLVLPLDNHVYRELT